MIAAMPMIQIIPGIAIDERELRVDFIRAGGPGGQNVNKVSTACQLRFGLAASSLPEPVKHRLAALAGSRLTGEGEIVISAGRFRTQLANRQAALERLVELIRQAARPPKKRRPTRPTAGSRKRRLDAKRRRGQIKQGRRGERAEE